MRYATSPSRLLGFALISLISHTAFSAVTLDVPATVSRDQSTAAISTTPFSTASGNELLLALIATDYVAGPNTTVTGVSGGGLNWVLVRRTNVQSGTSEIWRAFAPSPRISTPFYAFREQRAQWVQRPHPPNSYWPSTR
jgi:hypothetical protein